MSCGDVKGVFFPKRRIFQTQRQIPPGILLCPRRRGGGGKSAAFATSVTRIYIRHLTNSGLGNHAILQDVIAIAALYQQQRRYLHSLLTKCSLGVKSLLSFFKKLYCSRVCFRMSVFKKQNLLAFALALSGCHR